MTANRTAVDHVDVDVYRFPAPAPEADGTLHWDATTAVVVHVHAGGTAGLGWTYSSPAAAAVVRENLREAVIGATRPTSPAPGRRCTAAAATSVLAGWSCRRSAPSTWRCGT